MLPAYLHALFLRCLAVPARAEFSRGQVISARPDFVEDEDDAWPPVREQEPPAEADPDQVKEAYRIIMACEPLKKVSGCASCGTVVRVELKL
eukprot:101088-Pleurochrysis_carterae.AAC.1